MTSGLDGNRLNSRDDFIPGLFRGVLCIYVDYAVYWPTGSIYYIYKARFRFLVAVGTCCREEEPPWMKIDVFRGSCVVEVVEWWSL